MAGLQGLAWWLGYRAPSGGWAYRAPSGGWATGLRHVTGLPGSVWWLGYRAPSSGWATGLRLVAELPGCVWWLGNRALSGGWLLTELAQPPEDTECTGDAATHGEIPSNLAFLLYLARIDLI